MSSPGPIASIVVPAHNEERTIGRLLSALVVDDGHHFEIVVACNGCTDQTVAIAQGFDVAVLDLPAIGKHAAMREADEVASTYPRVYLDADVEISAAGVTALAYAVTRGPAMAAGPRRTIPTTGASWPVRAYYDVWEHLPSVRTGLFGRGVIALSRAGVDRIRRLPSAMSDDMVVSEAFSVAERVIIEDAEVVVHPPKTWADLIARRVRVVTGNAQADDAGLRGSAARTGGKELLALVWRRPALAVKVPVFVIAAVAARTRARAAIKIGDFTTWQRDESSREV